MMVLLLDSLQIIKKLQTKKKKKRSESILRRQRGWFMQRLRDGIKPVEISFGTSATLSCLFKLTGVRHSYIKFLRYVFECNCHTNYRKKLNLNRYVRSWDFISRCVLPLETNIVLLMRCYWLQWLLARSYRAKRLAICRPAHGQRRRSNAKTSNYCHTFLFANACAYELELFKIKQTKYLRYSKTLEMRLKSKKKSNKKVRKLPKKFKKATDKALVKKYKKKTPWQ